MLLLLMNYEMLQDECTVCLECLNTSKIRHLLCCNKDVHENCLKLWLKKDIYKRCPCCNQDVYIKFNYCEKLLCFNMKRYLKYY